MAIRHLPTNSHLAKSLRYVRMCWSRVIEPRAVLNEGFELDLRCDRICNRWPSTSKSVSLRALGQVGEGHYLRSRIKIQRGTTQNRSKTSNTKLTVTFQLLSNQLLDLHVRPQLQELGLLINDHHALHHSRKHLPLRRILNIMPEIRDAVRRRTLGILTDPVDDSLGSERVFARCNGTRRQRFPFLSR